MKTITLLILTTWMLFKCDAQNPNATIPASQFSQNQNHENWDNLFQKLAIQMGKPTDSIAEKEILQLFAEVGIADRMVCQKKCFIGTAEQNSLLSFSYDGEILTQVEIQASESPITQLLRSHVGNYPELCSEYHTKDDMQIVSIAKSNFSNAKMTQNQ